MSCFAYFLSPIILLGVSTTGLSVTMSAVTPDRCTSDAVETIKSFFINFLREVYFSNGLLVQLAQLEINEIIPKYK